MLRGGLKRVTSLSNARCLKDFHRWIASGLTERPNRIKVVFGSQTGTSMMFARQLVQELQHHGYLAELVDAEEYPAGLLVKETAMIFFLQSTFGHGEPTDNAVKLFEWIRDPSRDMETRLSSLHYAVFGCGQSLTYPERYQAASKYLDSRLHDLGAQRVFDRGEGDDNKDVEADFEKWLAQVMADLEALPTGSPSGDSSSGVSSDSPTAPGSTAAEGAVHSSGDVPAIACKPSKSAEPEVGTGLAILWSPLKPLTRPRESYVPSRQVDIRNPYPAPVRAMRELHATGSSGSCMHIELDVSKAENFSYRSGDYAGIYPANPPDLVARYAERLGVQLEDTFHVQVGRSGDESVLNKISFPTPCTVSDYLTHYADLAGQPRKANIRALLPAAKSCRDVDALESLMSQSYYDHWIGSARRTLLDVMEKAPTLDVQWPVFLEAAAPLQPRYYSIASASRIYPSTVHLCVGLNRMKDAEGKLETDGVCSGYLCKRLKVDDRVPLFVKKSLFKLPADPNVPVLLIGAGTGIAPHRAFLQERVVQNAHDNMLVFGCNHRDVDFLYQSELASYIAAGNLRLVTAFSHDQPYRIFVQHRIRENSREIWAMITRGAQVYICGSNQMGDGVKGALREIFESEGGLSKAAAEQKITDMLIENTIQQDLFG